MQKDVAVGRDDVNAETPQLMFTMTGIYRVTLYGSALTVDSQQASHSEASWNASFALEYILADASLPFKKE